MTRKQILEHAKEVLAKEGWTQGTMHRLTPAGEWLGHCAFGAIYVALDAYGFWDDGPRIASFVAKANHLPRPQTNDGDPDAEALVAWNDEPGRTITEVFAAFDTAIAACPE